MSRQLTRRISCSTALAFTFLMLLLSPQVRASGITRWLTQTVYVPLYSHIYADERYRNKPFNLTATLSIRNTDPENGLILQNVDYYDSEGKLLKKYLGKPVTIAPLASTRFIVQESESKGGSGAKFIVIWTAAKPVVEPIIESVMIGTKLQQGISFLSRGRVIAGESAD
ncbi:MAG: DUF3124 domain-containing protein [Desulfobulbaceae bacterium]|nr:DUF3124 domain-containing protein [Desulfobulbaceae bacterium]